MAAIGDLKELRVLAVNDWIGYEIAGYPSSSLLKEMVVYGTVPFAPKKLMNSIADDIVSVYAERHVNILPKAHAPQILRPVSLFLFVFDVQDSHGPEELFKLRQSFWIRKTKEESIWRLRRYRTLNQPSMPSRTVLSTFGKNPIALIGEMQTTVRNKAYLYMDGPHLLREGLCGVK